MAKGKKRTGISNTKFPDLPEFPGGKKAFIEFITKNLQYPEEAKEKRIEGDVFVRFYINDNGTVTDAKIEKGLGYGCDEEAVRLIKMMKFGSTKNRGFKLSVSKRVKIKFRLKNIKKSISYSYVTKTSKDQKDTPKDTTTGARVVYEYSVTVEKKPT